MSNYIDITTGTVGSTSDLVFLDPQAENAEQVAEELNEALDAGSDTDAITIGAQHGFTLDPFARIVFSVVDHPKLGTLMDVHASEGELLVSLEGLLDEDEEFDPEVGIIQHLIDAHGCVINIDERTNPHLKRVTSIPGMPGWARQG